MDKVRDHRVAAFCDWLDTIPPQPAFHTRPEFRFYSDLTEGEFAAAAAEMRRRGGADLGDIDALVAERERQSQMKGSNLYRNSARLTAIHVDHLPLDDLASTLGSPEEWLSAAVSHLKSQTSGLPAGSGGVVQVSVAALHLVLMHIEAIEHGGEPWRATVT